MDIDSILNLYNKTYYNLPRYVRSFLGGIYGSIPLKIRFGKVYEYHKGIVEHFENSDTQFQLDYMFNKTFETLQFAYDHIPHYTKSFDEFGFKPSDFKELGDLGKVPTLTKRMIQTDLNNLYTDKFDKPSKVQTGGSTFAPTKFYSSLITSRAKERAYNDYIFSKLDYRYRDKTLVFRGKDLSDENRGIYWHYEMVANQLWISPNHLNQRFIEKIVEEIHGFNPKFVWGFTHAISIYISQCQKKGIHKMEGIQGVFLSSEIVFQDQLEKIKEFFNCPVLSHYGHRESTAIGYRIDQSKYQFLNSYGATRIVDNEIVTTSFDNFVMPFINYKTQDYIMGGCDRIYNTDLIHRIGNIEGRLQDYIVTKTGTLRTALSIGMGHFDSFQYVDAAQYYQDTPGIITINIESSHPERVNSKALVEFMEKHVKHSIKFEINFLDKIEKSPFGKWKTVIQKLDIEKYR